MGRALGIGALGPGAPTGQVGPDERALGVGVGALAAVRRNYSGRETRVSRLGILYNFNIQWHLILSISSFKYAINLPQEQNLANNCRSPTLTTQPSPIPPCLVRLGARSSPRWPGWFLWAWWREGGATECAGT